MLLSSESRTVSQISSLPVPSEKGPVTGPHEIHTLRFGFQRARTLGRIRGEHRILAAAGGQVNCRNPCIDKIFSAARPGSSDPRPETRPRGRSRCA
jgi:hypothetical protein